MFSYYFPEHIQCFNETSCFIMNTPYFQDYFVINNWLHTTFPMVYFHNEIKLGKNYCSTTYENDDNSSNFALSISNNYTNFRPELDTQNSWKQISMFDWVCNAFSDTKCLFYMGEK